MKACGKRSGPSSVVVPRRWMKMFAKGVAVYPTYAALENECRIVRIRRLIVFGSCSSSGFPSASKACSPVSTEALSASSSITSRGRLETTGDRQDAPPTASSKQGRSTELLSRLQQHLRNALVAVAAIADPDRNGTTSRMFGRTVSKTRYAVSHPGPKHSPPRESPESRTSGRAFDH